MAFAAYLVEKEIFKEVMEDILFASSAVLHLLSFTMCV